MAKAHTLYSHLTLALLGLLFGVASTQGELVWENPPQSIAAPPSGKEARVLFPFQNTGLSPLHIETIQTSCACLTAELSKRVIAPGERGTLTASIRTIGKPAARTARIELVTAEAPSQPIRLQFQIQEPFTPSIEPALLWWKVGGDTRPRTAIIHLPKGAVLTTPQVPAESPFHSTVTGPTDDLVWKIEITPRRIDTSAEAQLLLEYQQPRSDTAEKLTLFLRILPPE
ncbi:MAG: DUF1573 domain-containing protein [Verrucomicrobiota bacterium]